MLKKSLLTLVALVVILGGIVATKFLQIQTMLQAAEAMPEPTEAVSSFVVERQNWPEEIGAVGSLEAAQGLTITADIPGRVSKIHFVAGAEVKKGDVLLEQETSTERAQLRAAEAAVQLARSNLKRAEDLVKKSLVPQSQYDQALAEFRRTQADVDNIRSLIDKKRIVAPFSGKLGRRQVDVGEDIVEGQPIVTLQSAELMYVNFHLPQRALHRLHPGLAFTLQTDAAPDETFNGSLTVIDPEIEVATRQVRVQGTLESQHGQLLPGMFTTLKVRLDQEISSLVVPQTAVKYATFGDSVYVLTPKDPDDKSGVWVAKQQLVRLGPAHGDFVAVEKGLNEGDVVASAGIFKLRNGIGVTIHNEVQPDYRQDPAPENK